MKKYIIFDLDGTLIDSMPVWTNIGSNFLIANGINPPTNLLSIVKKQTLPETAQFFRERFKLPLTAEEIIEQITFMVEREYQFHIPLKPYALEYLEKARAAGSKMCILTASESSYVQSAIERLKLPPYFEFVMTCTEMGLNKHDPKVFQMAMERLGGNIADTAVFEDAPYAIRTAKAGGFYVIAVADETTRPDIEKIKECCDQYINSFEELL